MASNNCSLFDNLIGFNLQCYARSLTLTNDFTAIFDFMSYNQAMQCQQGQQTIVTIPTGVGYIAFDYRTYCITNQACMDMCYGISFKYSGTFG